MTKKEQRDEKKNALASLDKSLYHSYSHQITSHFLMEDDVKKASVIGLTISTFPEVDTERIIKSLWEIGKTVVVPKCSPKDRKMTFYKIESFEQLETVYMQLLEPNPSLTSAVRASDIDLLVVPGIVYSTSGYRIGYGGGYYDRFLADYSGRTVSLAFDLQISNAVQSESFDLPVDKIITNTQIIDCSLNREEVN